MNILMSLSDPKTIFNSESDQKTQRTNEDDDDYDPWIRIFYMH